MRMNTLPMLKSLGQQMFLENLLKTLGVDLGLSNRDVLNLVKRLKTRGHKALTCDLPNLGLALVRGISDGRFILPGSFKATKRGGKLPALLGTFFSKVFDEDGTYLGLDACPYSVMVIWQITQLFKKTDLPYNSRTTSNNKDRALISAFVGVEKEMSDFAVTMWQNEEVCDLEFWPVLETAAQLVAEVFPAFEVSDLDGRYKHGPGTTSDAGRYDKFEAPLPQHDSPVNAIFGISPFVFNESEYQDRSDKYIVTQTAAPVELLGNHPNLLSQVILVPKDSRGPRIISCEPWSHQYLQQGIMSYMVEKIQSNEWTAGAVNFEDQTINQALAEVASRTHEWSTLDLKDASDRVNLQLVTHLFRGTPKLLNAMLACRTPGTVLPHDDESHVDGEGREVVWFDKFAPMGSALCFPVMAMTIFSLVVAAISRTGVSWRDSCDSVRVYGDDIIVKTEYASLVVDTLHRYGLRVNTNKCFIDSDFAESCGVDAFKGNNITPVKLRVCPNLLQAGIAPLSTSYLASLTETAHQLRTSGLTASAEFLYSLVEQSVGRLPYGSWRSSFLHRRASPDQLGDLEKLNFFHLGADRVKSSKDEVTGEWVTTFRVASIVTVEVEKPTSGWSHFQRIAGMLGSGAKLPDYGVFPLFGQTKLRWFDASWGDLTPVAPCEWLPNH